MKMRTHPSFLLAKRPSFRCFPSFTNVRVRVGQMYGSLLRSYNRKSVAWRSSRYCDAASESDIYNDGTVNQLEYGPLWAFLFGLEA